MILARSLLVLAVFSMSTLASAQPSKSVPSSQLNVDVVSLKSGKSLRGVIVRVEPNGSLTMAVSREWLRKANPELFDKTSTANAVAQRTAWEGVRDRLKKQLETPPASQPVVFFLKQELERIEKLLAKPDAAEESQFVWLDLDRAAVAKTMSPGSDRQRVALWSWSERLANIETRDANDLSHELKDRGVDATQPPPDLSDRLPARPQDDREWSARMALVEYTFDKQLDFQGTGDVLVRADTGRTAVDLAPILTKVLRQQVNSLFQELTGEGRPAGAATPSNGDWLKPATREADKLSTRGLRATRVELNLDGRQAAVHSAFAVRLANDQWEPIWSHREAQDGTKPRADAEARIANDPQVKKALDTMKSLGLGAEDQVQQAIRFGAATMAAQQAVDARFFEFRDRYVKHLDGPPLWWTK